MLPSFALKHDSKNDIRSMGTFPFSVSVVKMPVTIYIFSL